MQIKQVLKSQMEIIYNKLLEDESIKRQIQFEILLPKIPNSLFADGNINPSSSILSIEMPVSLIAKQLFDDSDIINAFKLLYNKYIDSNNAPFMINISSDIRNPLMELLDEKYHKRMRIGKKSQITGDSIKSSMVDRLKAINIDSVPPSTETSVDITVTNEECNVSVETNDNYNKVASAVFASFIEQEFERHGKCNQWLLTQLLTAMDDAAKEISQLMCDSFRRYKKKNKDNAHASL